MKPASAIHAELDRLREQIEVHVEADTPMAEIVEPDLKAICARAIKLVAEILPSETAEGQLAEADAETTPRGVVAAIDAASQELMSRQAAAPSPVPPPEPQDRPAETAATGGTVPAAIGELRSAFTKDMESTGLTVFLLTALGTILFIFIFNLFPGYDTYPSLRSTELLLKLAAVGLVITLIGKAQNVFVTAFGIFLIGALIVPSHDIVRFALLASGSDRDYNDGLFTARAGADLEGRSSDVAAKILNELEQYSLVRDPLEVEDRKFAIEIIQEEIRKEREITLLEQVRGRGALAALEGLAADPPGTVYKYSKDEKFIDDLRYLRSEGLIRFAYDNVDAVGLTGLGRAVLRRVNPVDAEALFPQRSDLTRAARPPSLLIEGECPVASDSTLDLLQAGVELRIGSEAQYLRFQVDESGTYTIGVAASRGPGPVDPLMYLLRRIDDDGCSQVLVDDDGGDGLNSRAQVPLETGRTYFVGAASLGVDGIATVSVQRPG